MDVLKETEQETAEFEAMMREEAPPAAPPAPADPPPEPPAPEAKAEPEAAPAAEKPAPAPAPEKPVRLVPHQALHEERETRKRLERELAEIKARLAPPPSPADEMPDEQTDPIGTIRWLKAQREREDRERQEAQQQQAYMADLAQKVGSRVTAYAAEHPEYNEQVKFLREFRFRELVEGLAMPPELAARQIQQEEFALGQMAVTQDLDPGAMVAKLATVRGWKAKEAEKPAPAPAPEAVQQIDRLERGRRAAVSPSAAGGSGPEPAMTAEALLALEGAAFDQAFAKHGKRLFGG